LRLWILTAVEERCCGARVKGLSPRRIEYSTVAIVSTSYVTLPFASCTAGASVLRNIDRSRLSERERHDVVSFGEDLTLYQLCGHRLRTEGCEEAADSSSVEL
jgi:hypothetical protein